MQLESNAQFEFSDVFVINSDAAKPLTEKIEQAKNAILKIKAIVRERRDGLLASFSDAVDSFEVDDVDHFDEEEIDDYLDDLDDLVGFLEDDIENWQISTSMSSNLCQLFGLNEDEATMLAVAESKWQPPATYGLSNSERIISSTSHNGLHSEFLRQDKSSIYSADEKDVSAFDRKPLSKSNGMFLPSNKGVTWQDLMPQNKSSQSSGLAEAKEVHSVPSITAELGFKSNDRHVRDLGRQDEEKELFVYDDDEDDYDDEDDDDDDDDSELDQEDDRPIAMSLDLMRIMGMQTPHVQIETDWRPPEKPGLDNSARLFNIEEGNGIRTRKIAALNAAYGLSKQHETYQPSSTIAINRFDHNWPVDSGENEPETEKKSSQIHQNIGAFVAPESKSPLPIFSMGQVNQNVAFFQPSEAKTSPGPSRRVSPSPTADIVYKQSSQNRNGFDDAEAKTSLPPYPFSRQGSQKAQWTGDSQNSMVSGFPSAVVKQGSLSRNGFDDADAKTSLSSPTPLSRQGSQTTQWMMAPTSVVTPSTKLPAAAVLSTRFYTDSSSSFGHPMNVSDAFASPIAPSSSAAKWKQPEEGESNPTDDAKEDDDEEDEEDDDEYDDDEDEDDYDNMGTPYGSIQMSANLMRVLGIDTSHIVADTDWTPPAHSGLSNSSRLIP